MNIERICKKYGIKNYTINVDGSIDVEGNVDLRNKGLSKLPLKFNRVTGNFSCSYNQLTTLEGCPTHVGGNFSCYNNQLTSLQGSPTHVGGGFYCHSNLTSLEGSPIELGGEFYCDNIQSLIPKMSDDWKVLWMDSYFGKYIKEYLNG